MQKRLLQQYLSMTDIRKADGAGPIAVPPCGSLRGTLPSVPACKGRCARSKQSNYPDAILVVARELSEHHQFGPPGPGWRRKFDDRWSIRIAVEWPYGRSRWLPRSGSPDNELQRGPH